MIRIVKFWILRPWCSETPRDWLRINRIQPSHIFRSKVVLQWLIVAWSGHGIFCAHLQKICFCKIGIASVRNVAPKNNFVNARSPVRKAQMKIRLAEFISYFFMLWDRRDTAGHRENKNNPFYFRASSLTVPNLLLFISLPWTSFDREHLIPF